MSYASRITAPRTLTKAEVARLLKATGKTAATYPDHLLFALALGTGLRSFELSALDCGDVYRKGKNAVAVKTRVVLRVFKRCSDKPAPQEVMLSDALRGKLERFFSWKWTRGEKVDAPSPLFCVHRGPPIRVRANLGAGRRMSARRMRERWARWRSRCDIDPSLGFHALRHTFCQRLYEQKRDVRLVQRAARHADMNTTAIYAKASADDVLDAVGRLEL